MGAEDTTRHLPNDQLNQIFEILTELRGEFAGLRGEVAQLATRLDSLENKVDARLKETRPIWEAVQTQIAELRDEVAGMRRDMRYKMDALNDSILELRADGKDLHHRLSEVERRPS